MNRIITVQPKLKSDIMNISIANAHEFSPHPQLSLLTEEDTLLVNEEVDYMEAIPGIDRQNRYSVMNTSGQRIFSVYEGLFNLV